MSKAICIPNDLIRNKDVSHRAFFLYVLMQIESNGSVWEASGEDILNLVGWHDIRALNKELEVLKDLGLINYDSKVTNKKMLIFSIYNPTSHFTLIDKLTVLKINEICADINTKDCRCIGVRYFYYLEMNYNIKHKKSYPTYDQISEDTGINKHYIRSLNVKLTNANLLIVTEGGWFIKYGEIRKKRNNYQPILNR